MATQNLGFGQYMPQGVNGGSSNPYLQGNVNSALDAVTRNYQNTVAPAMASQMAQSRSFGNSGLQAAQTNQQRGLADSLGATAGNMYGSAYATDRANDLSWANNQANNATQRYGIDQSLIGQKYSSDNALKGTMYGSDNALAGTKYAADASSGASMYGSDNALKGSMYGSDNNLAIAGLNNDTARRGQDQSYTLGMGNLGLGVQNSNYNYDLGLRNNDLAFNTLDANIYNRNFDNQMTAARFGLDVNNTLNANNGTTIAAGNEIQNTPQTYNNNYNNLTNSIGGQGGSTTQQLPGNQVVGAIGGAQMGSALAGNLGFGGSSKFTPDGGAYAFNDPAAYWM